MFVTFEGGEGAGKTTLIRRMGQYLRDEGLSVVETREPGGLPFAEAIRTMVLEAPHRLSPHAELCLFLAARAEHIGAVIAPALSKGSIVLCDRFNDSTIAYQGYARGLGPQAVEQFAHFICHGVEPNLTLVLDLNPVIGLTRAKKRSSQDHFEKEAILFHETVRKAFLEIAHKSPKRCRILDASLSEDEVYLHAIALFNAHYRP